jgi:hypothetical protein
MMTVAGQESRRKNVDANYRGSEDRVVVIESK